MFEPLTVFCISFNSASKMKGTIVNPVLMGHSLCVCVCSNSRNDVPRVAQRYETIAAHTRRRASVLVVFVVFCVHMYSFAGLIRRTLPPTFSDTAITDRHSDITIFHLRAHWVRISWSIGSEKIVRTCAPGGSRTLNFLRARRAPYPLGQALRGSLFEGATCFYWPPFSGPLKNNKVQNTMYLV